MSGLEYMRECGLCVIGVGVSMKSRRKKIWRVDDSVSIREREIICFHWDVNCGIIKRRKKKNMNRKGNKKNKYWKHQKR